LVRQKRIQNFSWKSKERVPCEDLGINDKQTNAHTTKIVKDVEEIYLVHVGDKWYDLM